MNEIEIKLKVSSFDGIREKLSNLGFEIKKKDVERVFIVDDEKESLRSKDITVRIKTGNGWASFAVKRKNDLDSSYKSSDEYQTDISDSVAMEGALGILGFGKAIEYSKEREHWTDGKSSVEIDYIPEIEKRFIEVEAESGEKIEELITMLGLQNAERDRRSYPMIIRETREIKNS